MLSKLSTLAVSPSTIFKSFAYVDIVILNRLWQFVSCKIILLVLSQLHLWLLSTTPLPGWQVIFIGSSMIRMSFFEFRFSTGSPFVSARFTQVFGSLVCCCGAGGVGTFL